MVTDSERATRGAGDIRKGPREWKVRIGLTNEVPVILARTDTRGVLQRVQDEKFWARLFPGKMRMWRAHVWKAFVNLVRNTRRLASPWQTYDDGDVVLAFAGQCTDCEEFISMGCIKFAIVISQHI